MDKDRTRHIIITVMTVIWMAVIFMNSAFDGGTSSGLSDMVVGWALKIIMLFGEGPVVRSMRDFLSSGSFHLLLRKSAHFVEFGILGALVYGSLGIFKRLRDNRKLRALAGAMLCLAYAGSDEFHQLFVAGRNASLWDVAIDFCGALAFIGIMVAVNRGKENEGNK